MLPFRTPTSRFSFLALMGGAAFAFMIIWSLAPETGFAAQAQDWRPLSSIPLRIWVSLLSGLLAFLIASWIWSFRPLDIATSLFAASGLATLLFTYAGSTDLVRYWASDVVVTSVIYTNIFAATGFGIVMACLFSIYPRSIPDAPLLCAAIVLGFGSWTVAKTIGPFRDFSAVQTITFVEMMAIVVISMSQVWASRRDPKDRAIAIWLGLSVILGAGPFIALIAVPATFGLPALIDFNYAVASFLVIYIALAVGLARYRIFELGAWSYRVAFYVLGAFLVLAVDIAVIRLFALDPGPALGVSLILVAMLYLPLRDLLWDRAVRRTKGTRIEPLKMVIAAGLQTDEKSRAEGWRDALQRSFSALSVENVSDTVAQPRIQEEGLSLLIPGTNSAGTVALRFPRQGRGLFNSDDVALSQQLHTLMVSTEESLGAYERGAQAERTRIARDIHDNIGAQLLRALHSPTPGRKDEMIRDTLADLRDVINNAQNSGQTLDTMLADLRAETADRTSAKGIQLIWRADAPEFATLSPQRIHTIRSLVREATSNTIKHAEAQQLTIDIRISETTAELTMSDDGRGLQKDQLNSNGHGLQNMRARIESLGGTFTFDDQSRGLKFSASLPLE